MSPDGFRYELMQLAKLDRSKAVQELPRNSLVSGKLNGEKLRLDTEVTLIM